MAAHVQVVIEHLRASTGIEGNTSEQSVCKKDIRLSRRERRGTYFPTDCQ